ncbi:hypothetical protein CDLVIII_1513 [Clostridium sp. DL-VIII]|uniref:DUF4318 domain-containing protein n=1 Tax=Clostridium sp. DL-VIII TaxID=641107 RepID=UPI00023AF1BF|nr:DUF4318 domain-containing protein [Clostridium sp. DL-VIII]EHI98205.1 hypothetical protein CDLVIII_1513 [Clostridium sp. DL-VIII]
MMKEDRVEIISKGLFLAVILFLSTVINLLIQRDIQHLKSIGTFLIPIILCYCLIGIFIRWIVYRNTLIKDGYHIFSGAAAIYWIFIFTAIIMFCAFLIPKFIRDIITVNVIILLLIWFLNYIYLKRIATELNSGIKHHSRVLIEDLPEKPQSEGRFIGEIENYCKRNNLSLDIIEYGIPSKIKMNNTMYVVKLGQYYDVMGGMVYTLEFHNIVSNK